MFRKSLGVLLALFGLVATASAATLYKVEDLGTLPGDFESMPWGINAKGDVVGSSTGPRGLRAFAYTDKTGMFELPSASPGAFSVARDINDYGQVVGQSNLRAVRWDLWSDREVFFGARYLETNARVSEAMAINGFGDIVGWIEHKPGPGIGGSDLSKTVRHAFFYTGRRGVVDITPTGEAEASDINDAGQVVGTRDGKAFMWDGATTMELGELRGYRYSSAFGINELGDVVGNATNEGLTSQHVFMFTQGFGLEDLGGIGDQNLLRRVNSDSDAVGRGRHGDGKLQGLIYSGSTGLQGLNALITEPQEWYIQYATDINDAGVIVASALNIRLREWRAVRLVPVSEEKSCLAMCMRSTAIELITEVTRDFAKVQATVVVEDESGSPLQDVEVSITWSIPGKLTRQESAVGRTDAKGRVVFQTYGGRGTYTISVDNLGKKGYEFDAPNSELQASIEA